MRVKIKDNYKNSTGFHAISVSQDGEILTEVQGWIEIEIENFTHLSHMFPLLFNSEAELMNLIEFYRSFNRRLEGTEDDLPDAVEYRGGDYGEDDEAV